MALNETMSADSAWEQTLVRTERGLVVAKVMIECVTTERFLLLQRSFDPEVVYTRRGKWDAAGGFGQYGEGVRTTGSRELEEEVGLHVPERSLGYYVEPFQAYDEKNRPLDMHVFRLRVCREFTPVLSKEHVGAMWAEENTAHKLLSDAPVGQIEG